MEMVPGFRGMMVKMGRNGRILEAEVARLLMAWV